MCSESDVYDDPEVERHWAEAQRQQLLNYLARERVSPRTDLEVCWVVAPHVALWREEPGGLGDILWVISGDLPTDYMYVPDGESARDVMSAFSNKWTEVATAMLQGRPHPMMHIGDTANAEVQRQLGDLLSRRAAILGEWAQDESMW